MMSSKRAKREARQLFHLCRVDGLLDESRVLLVTRRIIAAGHRSGMAMLAQFARLVRLDRAAHMASVESATPLEADVRALIQDGLTRRYGAGLATVFTDRPSLIAGVRIQVGSDLYDGSIRAGLEALEKSF
jgi:F-type H+-transporting ATPase subunit delta